MKPKTEYVIFNSRGMIVCSFSTAEAAFNYKNARLHMGNNTVCKQTTSYEAIIDERTQHSAA